MRHDDVASSRLTRVKQGPISSEARRFADATRAEREARDETSNGGFGFKLPAWLLSGPMLLVGWAIFDLSFSNAVFNYRRGVEHAERSELHRTCLNVTKPATLSQPMTWTSNSGVLLGVESSRRSTLAILNKCATEGCKPRDAERATESYVRLRLQTLDEAYERFGERGVEVITPIFASKGHFLVVTTAKELVRDGKLDLDYLKVHQSNALKLMMKLNNSDVPVCMPQSP